VNMNLTCPYCERTFDLDQVENADQFRERAELAAKLGRAWRLANEYIDCFRQQRGSRITLKKRVRILRELTQLWEGQQFALDGKRYKISQDAILKALNAVCNMDKTGFQNHNYLKRTMLKDGERLSEEGLTAREEAGREEARRRGRKPSRRKESADGMHLSDWMEQKGFESVGDILKGGKAGSGLKED
jgi:hypothetical protein